MASAPEVSDPPELQTVMLKVSIHCEGCKKKVKKVLWRVEGVGHIDIDSKQNKVTVTGSASAESLIKKLVKYGKQAELWPDTKPAASNSSPKTSGEPKEEGKEKSAAPASATTATPPETEQQPPTKEKKQEAEDAKTAPPPQPETTKTAPTVSATATSGEVIPPKHNIDAEESKASEAPAKSEKPATASDSENIKKKAEITGDERAVSDSDKPSSRTANTVAAMNPPTPHPFPAHPPPAYITSYSTVRPSVSYSYYVPSPAPAMPSSYTTYSDHPPAVPSSYATYSNYPPPAMPSSYTAYSSYAPVPPENYSTYSYYGSLEAPAASEGSYDMFNEENPNSCNLM